MRRQIVAYYAVNGGEGLHDIARAAVATLAQEQTTYKAHRARRRPGASLAPALREDENVLARE